MPIELIHDRGRGPEIVGTRITVYNLLPHLMDPTVTEAFLCEFYGLTPEELAAARAYALTHYEAVMAEHRQIEVRIAEGNPPQLIERAKQTHEDFLSYRERITGSERSSDRVGEKNGNIPTFREWVAEQNLKVGQGG